MLRVCSSVCSTMDVHAHQAQRREGAEGSTRHVGQDSERTGRLGLCVQDGTLCVCANDVPEYQSAAAGEKARRRATDRDAPRWRALPERALSGLQHASLHNVGTCEEDVEQKVPSNAQGTYGPTVAIFEIFAACHT